jgi:hypothetical protein
VIIETEIRYRGTLIRDRILISEVELLHMKPEARPGIIQTAKRLCAVRCISKWRQLLLQEK